MLVFVLVNAAQIVTVREVRNVAATDVVVSAVLLYDKVNTDFRAELHLLVYHESFFFFGIPNFGRPWSCS